MPIRYGSPSRIFRSKWDTTQTGVGAVSNKEVSLPLESAGTYSFRIDWGDGKSNRDTITAYDQAEVTHTYDETGIYDIRIIEGITGWRFNSNGEEDKILEINEWGALVFRANAISLSETFENASNLFLYATDKARTSSSTPQVSFEFFQNCDNLSGGFVAFDGVFSSWRRMFANSNNYDEDLSNMDISIVTNMERAFRNTLFTNKGSSDISGWDTSNVTTMESMFQSTPFNHPIGTWDTSSVVGMGQMFRGTSFDQDIGNWDTSNVTSMNIMFADNTVFNNGGSPSISGWDTSKVTNMGSMFSNTDSFNQDIGAWDVSSVTIFDSMFRNNNGFNNGGSSSISGWVVTGVNSSNDFYRMFENADSFNQNIGAWDMSNATSIQQMFSDANVFNNGGSSDINNWNTSGITNMSNVFNQAAAFNQPIGDWNVGSVTSFLQMFRISPFNQPLSGWNIGEYVNGTISMLGMFASNSVFNQPIGSWDTSKVTNINTMFQGADAFDQDLSNWVVTGITDAQNFMLNADGLSTENYDRTLSGWAQQSGDLQAGVSINFGNSQCSIATGLQYKEILSGAGWTITDGEPV